MNIPYNINLKPSESLPAWISGFWTHFILVKRLQIRWFPRLRLCGRCRNPEIIRNVNSKRLSWPRAWAQNLLTSSRIDVLHVYNIEVKMREGKRMTDWYSKKTWLVLFTMGIINSRRSSGGPEVDNSNGSAFRYPPKTGGFRTPRRMEMGRCTDILTQRWVLWHIDRAKEEGGDNKG